MIGPSAPPTPANAAQIAIAFGRSWIGNEFKMIESVAGMIDAAPDAHHGAEPDELSGIRCLTRSNCRAAEDEQPDFERSLPTEPISQGARGKEQSGEHERVGVDDPLQLGARRSQLALDRRQRDVDRAHGDDDRDEAEVEDREDQPAPVVDVGRDAVRVQV